MPITNSIPIPSTTSPSPSPSHHPQYQSQSQSQYHHPSSDRNPTSAILNFLPIQLPFPPHPPTPYPPAYFPPRFDALFHEIEHFAQTYFCSSSPSSPSSFPSHSLPSLRIPPSPELLTYISHIASPPPSPSLGWDQDWDPLLHNPQHQHCSKKYLVVAIIARVLETHVFARDLFGVDERGKEVLGVLDRGFVGRGRGSGRSGGDVFTQHHSILAQTTRLLLSTSSSYPLTPHFHTSVAHLTAQLLLLLHPLFTLSSNSSLDLPPPAAPPSPSPTLSSAHQSLHNIIARSAHLAICTRLSDCVVQYTPLRAGDITAAAIGIGKKKEGKIRERGRVAIAVWPWVTGYMVTSTSAAAPAPARAIPHSPHEEEEEEVEEHIYTFSQARAVFYSSSDDDDDDDNDDYKSKYNLPEQNPNSNTNPKKSSHQRTKKMTLQEYINNAKKKEREKKEKKEKEQRVAMGRILEEGEKGEEWLLSLLLLFVVIIITAAAAYSSR